MLALKSLSSTYIPPPWLQNENVRSLHKSSHLLPAQLAIPPNKHTMTLLKKKPEFNVILAATDTHITFCCRHAGHWDCRLCILTQSISAQKIANCSRTWEAFSRNNRSSTEKNSKIFFFLCKISSQKYIVWCRKLKVLKSMFWVLLILKLNNKIQYS